MRTVKSDKHAGESVKGKSLPVPPAVIRAIGKLGQDLTLARRRRHISQESMAVRMGASLSTVRRMEAGDPRVPVHFIARALLVLGDLEALTGLLDTARDEIGLTLMDSELPKRVRAKKQKNDDPAGAL
ncbi:helix-turn-helix domain-containing protein [Caballeronia sp.]|uniref:helix-turn-helix domain-containing protein n=1 Tax=Caballeronia sp. TaxID=1931223 RepID=UPI003C5371B8